MFESKVVIIGAGPAGAAAALFLAKNGIPSVVLEKETFPRDKICGDALSGKVVEVIRKLHPAWLNELQSGPQFLGSHGVTFVAPNGKALRVPFRSKTDITQPAPGFIAKRIDFDSWLMEKMRSEPLITVRENTVCRKFERIGKSWKLETAGGPICTQLVIAADGAYSSFAKQVGRLETEAEHNCFGLRAYYKNVGGLDHQNFIELHFLKAFLPGYFWIFPLPNGDANVGVGMRADVLASKNINLKKAFENILTESPEMAPRFKHAQLIGGLKAWGLPLGSKKRTISGDNFMLCGDAAMLIDPFTGEGIGNALMSGMLAAEIAVKACQSNDFTARELNGYDQAVYKRLGKEFQLSYRMQQLVNYPWLFNFVVNKAIKNETLRETISCMFEDIDLRSRLKDPRFYFKLIFG